MYLTTSKMNKLILVSLVALSLTACINDIEKKDICSYEVNNDTVILTNDSPILKMLEKQKVDKNTYSYELITSGIVRAIPNNYALIASPFEGRITRSFVRLGQDVNAGAPVFEISSSSYFETGKTYYQAKEEMNLAYKNLQRQKDLLSKGVGIEKDYEEAEVNYIINRRNYENSLASLKVYQVDTSNLVLGQPLIVRSPIKGRIVENNIVIGQYLKEDSEPVATVAELSKIWVVGQVKEKDVRYISDTEEVAIKLISFPEKKITGKIYNINSLIDENTRSIQVLIECNNKDKMMKPGMYVTTRFTHKIKDVIIIPSKAIFQMEDASFVFLQLDKNSYLKKKIEILTEDKDSSIVKTGLKPGDEIIVNGGFYLLEKK